MTNSQAIDKDGNSALHYACMRGHLHIVELLTMDYSLRSDLPNRKKLMPLHYALRGGYIEIVRFFVHRAPSRIALTVLDPGFGATSLHWATLSNNISLLEFALANGIKVDEVARAEKSTALLWACYGSSLETVKYLVENANADTKLKNQFGRTALHYAAASGSVEKMTYLTEIVKLKITEKDCNGKTPFDVAVGACAVFLDERKNKGFAVQGIADKFQKEQTKE